MSRFCSYLAHKAKILSSSSETLKFSLKESIQHMLRNRISILFGGLLLFCISAVVVAAQKGDVDFSGDYERIYQIRVVSPDAGGKSTIGSGFQVSADGLILTNYHVVSEYINSPNSYEIIYVTHDGRKGSLQLLDFDVISDLAVLRHPQPDRDHFKLASTQVQRGEVAYALGNPGDWGIVLVPGPTNGYVEHSYEQRVLFSGSLNSGMSGGPSLNRQGEVIGVNVATAGSQLSFLVPAAKASGLLKRKRQLNRNHYQDEIAQQLKAWQRPRIQELIDSEWSVEEFSDRVLFGEIRNDFQCWGDTNESDKERAMARVTKSCRAGDDVYLGNDLDAGQISFTFDNYKPVKLNRFQFARAIDTFMSSANRSAYKHSTNYRCETDFIQGLGAQGQGYQRVITCIRAYKKLAGLYDSLLLVQDHASKRGFVAQLSLSALEKDQIQALNRRFVERSL